MICSYLLAQAVRKSAGRKGMETGALKTSGCDGKPLYA